MKKSIFYLALLAFLLINRLEAQRTTDIKDGKDYPLLSRFDGSIIEYYKETKWDTYKLPVYKNNTKEPNYKNPLILSGKIIRTQYSVSPDNNPAYIMMNYEKAFKNNGFKILLEGKPGEDFEEGPASFQGDYYGSQKNLHLEKFGFAYTPIGNHKAIIVAKKQIDDKDIYIVEVISDFSNTTLITQDVIEVAAADTGKVTAGKIEENMDSKGHMIFYAIHFDTGSAQVKPESNETLKTLAAFIQKFPDKKFLIVGHTDNTGDFESNIILSKKRAEAVKNILVNQFGINAGQLKTFGNGSAAPIAKNTTEKGKAKNRRVELVAL